MSVGDIKGSRRRFKQRQQQGHAPRPMGLSVSALINRNQAIAKRMAASKGTKK